MKVFLSSTYNDLIEHRKAAHDALEQLGLHVIWMEAFGARPEESTKACLDEVQECELFVGIYAHRYGYIPKDAAVSITEQEFDRAQELDKPIFGFIVDDDFIWHQKYFEHDKKADLDAFVGKVKTQPVEFFTTPDNLAQKIASSIGRYISEQKIKEQSKINVNVGGNFNGNLTIGDHNSSNVNQSPIYQPSKPTGSTLPNQPYFFGREKELQTIADAISPESRTWGALIDGPGGIGKTALAIEAARQAPENIFERKIFITAKVRELKPEGEKPLTDFTRADYLSMLNELAVELIEDGILHLAPDGRADALRIALAEKKALIVFDNLETLHPDERERLFQFLSRLPQGNKAIVTSRRRDNIDARVIRLDRMEKKESLELIEKLAENNSRLARENKEAREKLYEITNGNPLLIKWVCGQLGRAGSAMHTIAEACKFIENAPKGNDPLEYIFGDLLETFTENETKVLAALTYFTQPAKLKWLAQMTDLPERAAETALEDLADRSILIANNESKTFYLPPLAAQFIKTRRPEAVAQTGDALTDRAYALVMQYGGFGNQDYEKFPMLDAEWDFVSAALPRLLTGDNTRLQTVCDRLDQFLDFTGRWDDWLWLSTEGEMRAFAADDKESAGWQAYRAGRAYRLRNQPAEVLACAARSTEYWRESTLHNQATAISLRGLGHNMEENYLGAIASFREALNIYRSISPESIDVSIELNNLAGAEKSNKDYSAAERDYREALRISRKNNNQEHIATRLGNLAGLALDLKKWAEAESLAREALALAEKIGRQELIASDCHRLAEALLKQNRATSEALTLARRAVEIFTRLKSPDLQSAQKTVAEIEEKLKDK